MVPSFKNIALIFPEISLIQFLPLFSCSSMTQETMILREHIPVPYDNLFQSILSFASRCQSYF